jgi:trk system potassium uptake protein TrkH
VQRRGIRHPARLVPLTFLGLIALGTLLLMLPLSHAGPGGAPLITALFTATSAVCVTGLITVDTPTYWSGFGQAVILLLFQIGGFGIMTGATLLGLLVSKRLGLQTRLIAQAETGILGLGDVRAVLKLILVVTLAVEAAVALWLAARLAIGYGAPLGHALWSGMFHAVSAFNNAGFSVYSEGMVRFQRDALVLVPIMVAIVLGGIGFPVLHELRCRPREWHRWSVHTKITLLGTAILLSVGAVALYAYEAGNSGTLGTLGAGERLLNAAFLSVSARTAGFNAIDIGTLTSQSLAIHYLLMFIGGGSAGTAGGIKVTTFFLLGFVVWAEVRGRGGTSAFRRHIAAGAQRQALTIALLGIAAVGLGTLALLSLTPFAMEDVLFEVISAFATVGLSTGITGQLPAAGQLVLVVLMFLGRVGTITVATALALDAREPAFRYPEERPIVG